MEELLWEPALNASRIRVAVHRGTVTLIGVAGSYLEKVVAERVVRRIKDIKVLIVDIAVQLSNGGLWSDQDIAGHARNVILAHIGIPSGRIKIKVQGGHLTLDGDVEWQYQKDAAAEAVKGIAGLTGLSNFLFIKPKANVNVNKEDIERSLRRKAELHGTSIDIQAAGNRVTLKGSVRTWAEKQVASLTAWSFPGVITVIDELEVVQQ
jgi:osmotically-inducible protein OsmY